MYVDDAVVISPEKDQILAIIRSLKAYYVLTDDGNLHNYLGVCIVHNSKRVMMYQPKMTCCCLEVLLMLLPDNHGNKIKMYDTPATQKLTLHADAKESIGSASWNY